MRLAACILGFLVGGLNLVQGSLQIPQCSAQGWLEIRADDQRYPPDVTCTGFATVRSIQWQLLKRGNTSTAVQASHTCSRKSTLSIVWKCEGTSNDIRVYRPDDSISDLYIDGNHRNLVGNGEVWCSVEGNATAGNVSCKANVISPAELTNCKLMLTTNGTVAGTCNFTNAYSSNGTYICTWKLTPLGGQGGADVTIPGKIDETSYTSSAGESYYRGTCSFALSWLPKGQYSYVVRFFPGGQYQGTDTVTDRSTASPVIVEQTTNTDQSSSTEVYIAGGVAAAVVVIVAVVVVVVLVRRCLGRRLYDRPPRRRRQLQRQPEENPYTGLDVCEAVGQPAPKALHTSDTDLSLYDNPDLDREIVPRADVSPTSTAFTSDIGDGYLTPISPPCKEDGPPDSNDPGDGYLTPISPPYKEDGPPDSNDPGDGYLTPISPPYKEDGPPDSNDPGKNDYQSCSSTELYENDRPPDPSYPYKDN